MKRCPSVNGYQMKRSFISFSCFIFSHPSSQPPCTYAMFYHQPFNVPLLLQDNTQEVTLTKSDNGLGFSFIMCELDPPTRYFGSLVRIKELFPGQPAEQSGRIQEGDILLAINGQSLKELSYPVRADAKMLSLKCTVIIYIKPCSLFQL